MTTEAMNAVFTVVSNCLAAWIVGKFAFSWW